MPRRSYVKFVEVLPLADPRFKRLEVQTLRGECLGYIDWMTHWRQYTFEPDWDTEFSFDCLEDIAAKVKEMTATIRTPQPIPEVRT